MAIIQGVTHESFEVVPGRADAGMIVLCDHASNRLPAEYGTLGLPASELERHIAYDIGAAAVSRIIAAAFGAPAVLSRFSRLLIDPNRGADDPTLIMRLSDGAIVPGNRDIDAPERDRRHRRYYAPYHEAIEAVISACLANGRPPAIVSMHSFTEAWKGKQRPWHVGILWDRDDRMARPLIEALSADPTIVVGDNEPYKGSLEGDCLWQHATSRGLVNGLIEVRQDLIGTADGQARWADRLVRVLDAIRGRPDLNYGPALKTAASAPAVSTSHERPQSPAIDRRSALEARETTV